MSGEANRLASSRHHGVLGLGGSAFGPFAANRAAASTRVSPFVAGAAMLRQVR